MDEQKIKKAKPSKPRPSRRIFPRGHRPVRAGQSVEGTWADAAIKVLRRYDRAIQQKEILRIIQKENLKTFARGGQPLACLNAMLNHNSKTPDSLFYKMDGHSARFGLRSTRKPGTYTEAEATGASTAKHKKVSPASAPASTSSSSSAKSSLSSQALSPSSSTPSASPNSGNSKSSMLNELPLKKNRSRTGSTQPRTSSRRHVASKSRTRLAAAKPNHQRAATPRGPGSALCVMPPKSTPPRLPGAALCVMPPKKRPKLDEDNKQRQKMDDQDPLSSDTSESGSPFKKQIPSTESTLSSRLRQHLDQQQQLLNISPLTSGDETERKQRTPIVGGELRKLLQRPYSPQQKPIMKGAHHKSSPSRIQRSRSTRHLDSDSTYSSLNARLKQRPPVTGFMEVKLKRLKKMNTGKLMMSTVEQIKRTREGKVDLQSADSILTTISLKDLLNNRSFGQLPALYQFQLLKLVPDVDQVKGKDSAVRLSPNAMNNEFFNKACLEWQEKLAEGEFNVDIVQRVKQELEKSIILDEWKVRYFEPVYGESSLPDPIVSQDFLTKQGETSWTTFLKFAENNAGDYLKEFTHMQEKLKQGRQRQKEMDTNSPDKKATVKSPSGKAKGALGKPESVNKNRSKRALKRAQLVQRRKVLEKQLQEARAKYLVKVGEDVSFERIQSFLQDTQDSPVLKVEKARQINSSDQAEFKSFQNNASEKVLKPDTLDTKLTKSRYRPLNFKTPEERSAFLAKRNNRRRKPKTEKTVNASKPFTNDNENNIGKANQLVSQTGDVSNIAKTDGVTKLTTLVASITPDKVLGEKKRNSRGSGNSRKRNASNKRTTYDHSTLIKASTNANSRIIKGASIYVRGTSIQCPCTLAPLVVCQRCGAFCHEDCINVDKICTLCIPA